MNFVGDDNNPFGGAYGGEGLELLPGPDAPHGVVGRAEEDEFYRRVLEFFLQVPVVHLKPAVFEEEGVFHDSTPPPPDGREEGVVDGRLDQDAVPRLGKGEDGRCEGRNHPGSMADPFDLRGPAVPAGEPAGDCLMIGGAAAGIP